MSIRASQLFVLILLLGLSRIGSPAADWKIESGQNKDAPGEKVDFLEGGKPIARFIYGKGQFKPYLHVFAPDGALLTNPGLDSNGKTTGLYPHHRGIFIGWKIESALGTDDLWHMTKGCTMTLDRIVRTDVTSSDKGGSAKLVAAVGWHAAKKDESGSNLLLNEQRTITIHREGNGALLIDCLFVLTPERDLRFVGDLQHSGIHFRASNEVATRAKETAYVYEPDKVVKGSDLKWVRLIFPIGEHWYASTQLNPPSNPVEELSMRDYGRFGYFFKRSLKKGEPLTLSYRFVIEEAAKPSPELLVEQRKKGQALYDAFVR